MWNWRKVQEFDHWKFHAVRTDLQETIQKLAILTNSYYWTSPGRPMEGCPYSMHALFPKIVEPPTCAERKTREYTQHFKTLTYFHGNREGLSIHAFFLVKPRFVPRCSYVTSVRLTSPMWNHPSRLGHPQRLQHLNLPRGDCKHFPQLSSNSAVGSPRQSAVDPNEEPRMLCSFWQLGMAFFGDVEETHSLRWLGRFPCHHRWWCCLTWPYVVKANK